MIILTDQEVGIAIKRVGVPLPPGRLIAVNGEAGCQAQTLAPGWYFRPTWLYEVRRVPPVSIPPGQVGLVVARDGAPLPPGRNLGRFVPCANFEDGEVFLRNSGERGRQLAVLTTGIYRINTELFEIVTAENAHEHGLDPADLKLCRIAADEIGIVTILEGPDLPVGMRVAPHVDGHMSFQDPQRFLDAGGYKGLQSTVLRPGEYALNPWFARVTHAPLTHVPAGTVGVVISDAGDNPVMGEGTHALVEQGQRGVWHMPLPPGIHPINTQAMRVELVPTHQITLDWSDKQKPPSNYDSHLDVLQLRSRDGFAFEVEVTQVLQINAADAPHMISRIGSIDNTPPDSPTQLSGQKYRTIHNLVTRVLHPLVGAYFRNSAQDYEALKFHEERAERQREAEDYISTALAPFGVTAVGTFINEVDLPDELEQVLTLRTVAKMEVALFTDKREAEEARREWKAAQAQTEHESYRVAAQVEMERLRQLIEVEAERLRQLTRAFPDLVAFLEYMRIEALPKVKLPHVLVGSGGQISDALLAQMVGSVSQPHKQQLNQEILELLQGRKDNQSAQATYLKLKRLTESPNEQLEAEDFLEILSTVADVLQTPPPTAGFAGQDGVAGGYGPQAHSPDDVD